MRGSTLLGTVYYVFAAIVILLLIIFASVRILPNIRKKIGGAVTKIYLLIAKGEPFQILLKYYRKYVSTPVKNAANIGMKKLGLTAEHIQKSELFIQKAVPAVTIEPVNLLALAIRKCYTDNPAPLIALSASLIVVFYFILTVF